MTVPYKRREQYETQRHITGEMNPQPAQRYGNEDIILWW
jgi:hypothetical protein